MELRPGRPGVDICDFCGSTLTRWTHFMNPLYGTDWGACDECHALILAGNQAALRDRSVATVPWGGVVTKEMRRLLRVKITELHTAFWQHRTGTWRYDYNPIDGETQRSTP
jgi:hypothetical protein